MKNKQYLVDTNLLIYHTQGIQEATSFVRNLVIHQLLNISILTKIEFLGWDKHTPEGYEKCVGLIRFANIIHIDDDIAEKAIELRRTTNVRLADAVIAATAIHNGLILATNNTADFKKLEEISVYNPF